MRCHPAFIPMVAIGVLAVLPAPAVGQDVELLSEIYGTPLPAGYFQTKAANPRAFSFTRGRAVRLQERVRELSLARARGAAPLSILGPRDGPVTGTYRIPVLMGLFSDSPDGVIPFPREQVQEAYFGEGAGTITAYYEEVSGGRVTLKGELGDWTRSDLTQLDATGGRSGLYSGTAGSFIVDLLSKMPSDIDWGLYDNDGPDGVPNSGDDDGFVDALAVLHPTPGGECGGSDRDNRIWSHRWSLRFAAGQVDGWPTPTPSAGGDVIRVDDYLIQPIYTCTGGNLNQIGVFTHELGHAFGLPDLYDTDSGNGKHQGAGNWDLMATGSWGCDGRSAEHPCHMSAWSKMVLGWADVESLPLDTDLGSLTLPPVESTGKIYRVDAGDDSGEFYLLENRQEIGFDQNLFAEGLLVWRISQPIIDALWPRNEVNARSQLGVWLQEADGLNELATPGCPRGNAGDPFPFVGPLKGCGGANATGENRVFHAGSNPSSMSDMGTASGLTLLDVQRNGNDIDFRISTHFARYTVRSDGDAGVGGLFTVDDDPLAGQAPSFRSAPFQTHVVEAAAGDALGVGMRRPFTGWLDDDDAPRRRTVVTPLEGDVDLVAHYQGEQYELSVSLTGGQGSIAPGSFKTEPAAPDLWFSPGTAVTIEATPTRGFQFVKWTGSLEGQSNPASVVLSAPVTAGADFEIIYKVTTTTVRIAAAEDPKLTLEPENGTAPYYWQILSGTPPRGLDLNPSGLLAGAALATGSFPFTVAVTDALGLRAEGSFTLEVEDPQLSAAALSSKFLLVGPQLTPPQFQFLDLRGNRNGTYDLGDFRAWVLSHPGLPRSAALKALIAPRTVVIPMVPQDGPEKRR